MAIHDLPGIGLKGGFPLGYDGWDTDMNNSLRKLSALVQCKVLDRVASLPGSPTDGDMYIVTSGVNANAVAVRDEGAWYYLAPFLGWRVYDATFGGYVTFDGTVWVEEAAASGGAIEIVSAGDLTGLSTLDFELVAGYSAFELRVFDAAFSATSRDLLARLSFDGGSTFAASGYGDYQISCTTTTSSVTGGSNLSAFSIAKSKQPMSTTGYRATGGFGGIKFDMPSGRAGEYFLGQNPFAQALTSQFLQTWFVRATGTSVPTHIRVLASNTGTFTAGTAVLYGTKGVV